MSEMVERAKKAVEECGIDWQDWDGNYGIADKFDLIVRTVIAAMREPTGEMIDVGSYPVPLDAEMAATSNEIALEIWKAMIDAALAEKEEETK